MATVKNDAPLLGFVCNAYHAHAMSQAIVYLVGILVGVSLVASSIIALAVVIWANEMAWAIQLINNGFYILIAILPVALWYGLTLAVRNVEYVGAYATMRRALLTTLQGSLVGTLLGTGPVFLAVVVFVPVYFLQYPLEVFGPVVRDSTIGSHLLLAAAVAIGTSLPLGMWANYRCDTSTHQ